MRKWVAGMVLAGAVLGSGPALAQNGIPAAGPEESHIERPPRVKLPDPIKRDAFDRVVGKLFASADTDRNGLIALPEFTATIEARKTRAVSTRFAAIDTDRDKALSFAEFSAWQRAIGSASLSDTASAAAGTEGLVAEDIGVQPDDDRKDGLFARLVVPLNAVMLASANTDYDGGTSLAELLAFEGARFDKLDRNKDGWLTTDETE